MQRSIYQPDSRQAARYDIAPLTRIEINLLGVDRSGSGEFFPQVEGEYVFVEACDLPVSASLVSSDSSQVLNLSDGSSVTGAFKGLLLRHPLYPANVVPTDGRSGKLVLVVAKQAVYDNQYFAPIVRQVLPYNALVTAGAGGTVTYSVPVDFRARYLDVTIAQPFVLTAGIVSQPHATLRFLQRDGAIPVQTPTPVTVNGVAYTLAASVHGATTLVAAPVAPATFNYRAIGSLSAPIPAEAGVASITLQFAVTDNLVSAASAGLIARIK